MSAVLWPPNSFWGPRRPLMWRCRDYTFTWRALQGHQKLLCCHRPHKIFAIFPWALWSLQHYCRELVIYQQCGMVVRGGPRCAASHRRRHRSQQFMTRMLTRGTKLYSQASVVYELSKIESLLVFEVGSFYMVCLAKQSSPILHRLLMPSTPLYIEGSTSQRR